MQRTDQKQSNWSKLGHLFHNDDGSLPDIFVEPLTNQEIRLVYDFVMSHSKILGNPNVWSIEQNADMPIIQFQNPAEDFASGKIAHFRVPIALRFGGFEVPALSMAVGQSSIEFDYRMGQDWNPHTLCAFLQFLLQIYRIAPNCRIFQADEGSYQTPNGEFEETLRDLRTSMASP